MAVVCPPAETLATPSITFTGVAEPVVELLPNSPQYCLPHIHRLWSSFTMAWCMYPVLVWRMLPLANIDGAASPNKELASAMDSQTNAKGVAAHE
jgi:hypothetical protein